MASHENISLPSPESSPGDGGKKEQKRPRVPLAIESDQVHTEASDKKRKRKRKPKAKQQATDAPPAIEKPKAEQSHETSGGEPSEKISKETNKAKKAETETPEELPHEATEASQAMPEQGESHEQPEGSPEVTEHGELPLAETEYEGELFVSDRWRPEPEAAAEAVEDIEAPVEDSSQTRTGTRPFTPPHVVVPPPAAAHAVPPNPNQSATFPPLGGLRTPSPPNFNTLPPAGGGGNNIPPQPHHANVYPHGGGMGGNVAPPPAAANLAAVPRNQAERMRAVERGWDAKSLWTGIIIGGVIEHVRHKRKQKRRDKVHAAQVKEITKSHEATQEQLRQTETKAERTQTTLEKQLERLKRTVAAAVPQSPRFEQSQPAPKLEAVSPLQPPKPERTAVNPLTAPAVETKPKPAPEQIVDTTRPPELPHDHKVESSAWHNIEIDKKTGKAVENPTVAYGQEFQHEQHQEQLRRAIDEASMDSDSVRQQYAAPLGTVATDHTTQQQSASHGDGTRQTGKLESPLTKFQQTLQRSEPVDIALWIGLGIVVVAIIVAL